MINLYLAQIVGHYVAHVIKFCFSTLIIQPMIFKVRGIENVLICLSVLILSYMYMYVFKLMLKLTHI